MKNTLIQQLQLEGIRHSAILDAIAAVPREEFVADQMAEYAYENEALPIACGQTISQPYVVARMTELLFADHNMKKVLEVGTGSGYQAAVLSKLVDEVYSIERIHTLYKQSTAVLKRLDYTNVHTLYGDGYLGWPEHAPYDGIVVTAGSNEVPHDLCMQLVIGGRMVIPVGSQFGGQELIVVTREAEDRFEFQYFDPVMFVPMLHGKSEE